MAAFKLLLSLALVAVALAADVPQIPRATVKLSGPSSAEIGTPFVLTCTFNATIPKEENEIYPYKAEVSFFRGVGSIKTEEVFGTYKSDGSMSGYYTENLYEGINVFPATNTEMDNGEEMRKEYSVVVLVTKQQMSMGTGYQCAVKLQKSYKHAVVRYTSNAIEVSTM